MHNVTILHTTRRVADSDMQLCDPSQFIITLQDFTTNKSGSGNIDIELLKVTIKASNHNSNSLS